MAQCATDVRIHHSLAYMHRSLHTPRSTYTAAYIHRGLYTPRPTYTANASHWQVGKIVKLALGHLALGIPSSTLYDLARPTHLRLIELLKKERGRHINIVIFDHVQRSPELIRLIIGNNRTEQALQQQEDDNDDEEEQQQQPQSLSASDLLARMSLPTYVPPRTLRLGG